MASNVTMSLPIGIDAILLDLISTYETESAFASENSDMGEVQRDERPYQISYISRIVKQYVEENFSDYIPVKHPTAGLDSYDVFSTHIIMNAEVDIHEEGSPHEHLLPVEVFKSNDLPEKRDQWLSDKSPIQNSARVPLTQGKFLDLGALYERKVTRSDISQWVGQHKSIKDLNELFQACELCMVSQVLYCEKMVILGGGEPEPIRPVDSGPRPIAFKVEKLHLREGKIVLAPQGE